MAEFVIDSDFLEISTIGRESHIQRNGIAVRVFPVGDAGRDLPVLLVLDGDLAGRRVHHLGRRGPLGLGDPLVTELGRSQGVHLGGLHLDDSGFGATAVLDILLFRRVLDVGGFALVFVLVCEGALGVFSADHGQVIEFVLGVLSQGLSLGLARLDKVSGF